MRRILQCLAAWLLGMGMMLSGHSLAEELSVEDVEAIHEVVQTQLDAFAVEDAQRAFDQASDSTQALLGSPEALMDIVREWFRPLYRPQKTEFLPADVLGDQALQEVVITDGNSTVWIAIFQMSMNDEADWKIDSYHLIETASVVI